MNIYDLKDSFNNVELSKKIRMCLFAVEQVANECKTFWSMSKLKDHFTE